MKKGRNRVKKFLNNFENYLGQCLVLFMLVILMVQVIGRYLFGYAPAWIEEAARFSFVWVTYAAACNGVLHGSHLKIDAATKLFPKAVRPCVKYVGNAILFLYALVVTYYGWEYAVGILKANQISAALHVRMGYVYMVIPIFHLLMAVRTVQLTVDMVKHPENYTEEAEMEAQLENEIGKEGEDQ